MQRSYSNSQASEVGLEALLWLDSRNSDNCVAQCASHFLGVMQAIEQFRVGLMDTMVQACSLLKAKVIKERTNGYVLMALAFVV